MLLGGGVEVLGFGVGVLLEVWVGAGVGPLLEPVVVVFLVVFLVFFLAAAVAVLLLELLGCAELELEGLGEWLAEVLVVAEPELLGCAELELVLLAPGLSLTPTVGLALPLLVFSAPSEKLLPTAEFAPMA